MHTVCERLLRPFDNQRVQLPQECGEGFPCSCRREYERVAPARDRRPSLALRLARLAERFREPLPDQGMKSAIHLELSRCKVVASRDRGCWPTGYDGASAHPTREPCLSTSACGTTRA